MTEQNMTPASPNIELVIMSRPAMAGGFTPGHMMLAVSVGGVGERAWGFYPGGIKDEIAVGGWHRYTSSVVIPITARQYSALVSAIESYKGSKQYHLFSTNCRNFVMTVVQQAGIAVPDSALWPNDEGKSFMKMYGESWGQCLAR